MTYVVSCLSKECFVLFFVFLNLLISIVNIFSVELLWNKFPAQAKPRNYHEIFLTKLSGVPSKRGIGNSDTISQCAGWGGPQCPPKHTVRWFLIFICMQLRFPFPLSSSSPPHLSPHSLITLYPLPLYIILACVYRLFLPHSPSSSSPLISILSPLLSS